MYFKTAESLANAITEGWGKSFSYDDPRNSLQQRLLANIYQFSGVKSLTEAAAFSDLLTDEDGKLKSFSKFRRDVQALHGIYNEQYLNAEYANAVATAQMADVWHQYDDEDWLEFRTAGDDRVRPEHAKLDGIVQQKKSSFWLKNWPPLAWLCRCFVVLAKRPANPLSEKEAGKLAKGASGGAIFENNAGITGIVFGDDHPYFLSIKGMRELDAVRNYGLKAVDKILKQAESLPARQHMDTETDYYAWWSSMIKKHGINETDFVLEDRLGIKVAFESRPGKKSYDYFRDHIIRKQGENRHEYAANLEAILTDPDELWNIGDAYQYLKYFNDGMYVVTVINDGETVKAETMYRVDNEKQQAKLRKGILMLKK